MKSRGYIAAFLLGLIFGVALGPCTFGFMAPVLAATFKIAETDLMYAVALLGSFAVGHCLVITIAGSCTTIVQKYLNWTERSRGAVILRGICGFLVILGGLYLLYIAEPV
jgi:cytochrome c-type biogenesis protein